jgi:hypothetical protein
MNKALKVYASNLNFYNDLWDNNTDERKNLSRHERYKYLVNTIDVVHNNKQFVFFVFICSF